MTDYYQGRLLLLFFLWHFGCAHSKDNLWCYECNTNLSKGRSQECNDPYAPGPVVDLIQCPKNVSQQCLKSRIVYKSTLTTVRACVPSAKVESYCNFEDYQDIFPGAKIECHFCSVYACNHTNLLSYNFSITVTIISIFFWKFNANYFQF